MLSLLLAALVSTDPPFDVHRVAESAVCVPVSSTSVAPGGALDQFAFSLQWTTRAEALAFPDYPDELAAVYQERVFAAFGESPLFRGLVLVTGEIPHQWPLQRHIDASAGRRFSLAGHQLANGATLTVYPDEGEFLLTAPQDARDEPEIGVLIVRGTCEFFWSEGYGTASAER
ncbi:hypothetical protein HXX25_11860 [Hyphobacterium sp. CCMP332]|uniref:hypothetical protein n=1 Tax=Hyphobacterium sp. CCMP332 TaxID=2749086 RepID=UPI00164FDC5C|nr:hypothetical protein [Hyphobacterium sp. CCMP332]QNL19961.1 hypothetical protein HXX25_11860 [Hyphobacterium sp. CCMP332]